MPQFDMFSDQKNMCFFHDPDISNLTRSDIWISNNSWIYVVEFLVLSLLVCGAMFAVFWGFNAWMDNIESQEEKNVKDKEDEKKYEKKFILAHILLVLSLIASLVLAAFVTFSSFNFAFNKMDETQPSDTEIQEYVEKESNKFSQEKLKNVKVSETYLAPCDKDLNTDHSFLGEKTIR